MTNIQKNRDAASKQLDIQYASADKAKKSFGFIGFIFLAFLFGSVFGNDFIKLCVHYFGHLRDWWQRKNANQEKIKEETEKNKKDKVVLEMDQIYADDLEESLENDFFKLVKMNGNNK